MITMTIIPSSIDFPENEVSYYNDYESHITIEWIDRNIGTIRVKDSISFDSSLTVQKNLNIH